MLSSARKPEPSFSSHVLNILKTTAPIAASYDVSIIQFALNRLFTRLEYDTMAPVGITYFSTLVYAALAATLPVNIHIPSRFSQLRILKENQLLKEIELQLPLSTLKEVLQVESIKKAFRDEQLKALQTELEGLDDQKPTEWITTKLRTNSEKFNELAATKAPTVRAQPDSRTPLLPPDEKSHSIAVNINDDLPLQLRKIEEEITIILKNGWMASNVICVLAVMMMLFSKQILTVCGQDENEVANPAGRFFIAFACFFLAFPLRMVMEFAVLAAQKARHAMFMTQPYLALVIASQYFLSSSLPNLGLILGGSFVATALSFTFYLQNYFKNINFLRTFFHPSSFNRQLIWQYQKESIPFLITMVSDISTSFALALIASNLSNNALTAWGVGVFTLSISVWLSAAVNQSAWLRVANTRDSGFPIKKAIVAGLFVAAAIQILTIGITIPIPELFATYVAGVEAVNLDHVTSTAVVISGVILGLQTAAITFMRNLEDPATLKVTLAASGLLWVGIGLSYGMSQSLLGLTGIPTGFAIGACISALAVLTRVFNNTIVPKPLSEQPKAEQAAVDEPDIKHTSVVIPRSASSIQRELAQQSSIRPRSSRLLSCCGAFRSRATPSSPLLPPPASSMFNGCPNLC